MGSRIAVEVVGSENHCRMEIVLSEMKTVAVEGLKSQLRLSGTDVVEVDGESFFRLKPTGRAMIAMMTEGNDLAPNPLPKGFSLTSCSGMKQIIEARNVAQARELNSAGGSDLFANVEHAMKKQKRTRTAQQEINRQRAVAKTITVQCNWNGKSCDCRMRRPVQASDALWVLYDAPTLKFLINWMREAGFKEDTTRHLTHEVPNLPKGVVRYRQGYRVMWIPADGGKFKHKIMDTLQGAMQFQKLSDAEKTEFCEEEKKLKDAENADTVESTS